jgi:acyl carrier protein
VGGAEVGKSDLVAVAGAVRAALAEVAKRPLQEIGEDQKLDDDLHFDSLSFVEVAETIERMLQIRMDDSALARCGTVAELTAVVAATVAETAR